MISTKKWVLLVLLILVLAAAGAFLLAGRGRSMRVEISQDGTVLRTFDLAAVATAEEMTVTWEGRSNTIRIEPGKISVIHADCPDQICVHTAALPDGGEPIVCLPNRLVIRLLDGGSADAVTR